MNNIGHAHRWTLVCSCIESILKIKDPLRTLCEEDAFDQRFHGKIPTDEMFDSMSQLSVPLKMIKHVSNQIQSKDKTTVQHSLKFILQLGDMSKQEGLM